MELSQVDPQVIADHCRGLVVGTQLKIGGQKRVWQCAYQQAPYVLKALMQDEQALRRIRREIEIMHTCESRYLPKFGPLQLQELKLPTGQTVMYFLEEYIPGLPVASVCMPLPTEEVVGLALCISEAVGVLAAKGYVHRDIKPMNIIQRAPRDYVLIDAGFALDPDAEAISAPNAIVGTKAYLSPDQLTKTQKELDFRSDVFSLGVVLYECATGEHPFMNDEVPRGDVLRNILCVQCPDPQRFNPAIPGPLTQIILRLLRKAREERYSSVGNLQNALLAIR